jgi:hypothetical protein
MQVLFNDRFDEDTPEEQQPWETEPQFESQRAMTRHTSRSFAGRVSRQKSRRRELLGRQAKPGITVDTSFTRHRGTEPHQVFSQDEGRSSGSIRRSPWFGLGRSSTKNKGLGITKGTPLQERTHRTQTSVDRNEPETAISMTPGSKSWQEISPWDRRIPIGISVPTDSISDFSSLQANRHRAGSDATLVTPSIIITPAAVKSVWSPDTPFTESDYTPSIYSRNPFNSMNTDVPPVPALPAGVSQPLDPKSKTEAQETAGHARNDTLDSAGTVYEEDDDSRRKDRIMSTSTVFEEDETPLRERTVENSLAIDTSMVPTPRRSQGWWNVITTPFVMTPKSSTWTEPGHSGERTPDVPIVPIQYGTRNTPDSASPPPLPVASTVTVPNVPADVTPGTVKSQQTQQTPQDSHRGVTSPLSVMSASPVLGTAAIGTVLMPRQVEEPRQININIELQDRRPIVNHQPVRATSTAYPHVSTSATREERNFVTTKREQLTAEPTCLCSATKIRSEEHFALELRQRQSLKLSCIHTRP